MKPFSRAVYQLLRSSFRAGCFPSIAEVMQEAQNELGYSSVGKQKINPKSSRETSVNFSF